MRLANGRSAVVVRCSGDRPLPLGSIWPTGQGIGAEEAVQRVRPQAVLVQPLQRHRTTQARIVGAEDDAHAATAQLAQDLVAAQIDRVRHGFPVMLLEAAQLGAQLTPVALRHEKKSSASAIARASRRATARSARASR